MIKPDKKVIDAIKKNPKKALSDIGITIPENANINIVKNTKDTFYCVIPDENFLNDELTNINAAGLTNVGSVSSAGTASTVSSACSSVSTVGSVGSVGTAGSLKS